MARKTTGKKPASGAVSGASDDSETARENAAETTQPDTIANDAKTTGSKQSAALSVELPPNAPESTAEDASEVPDSAEGKLTATPDADAASEVDPDKTLPEAQSLQDPQDPAPADPVSVPTDEATDARANAGIEAAPAEQAAAAAPPPPAAPPASKGGFFPLLLGGVLAGGIGYGAHSYLAGASGDRDAEIAALQSELAQLRAAIETVPQAPDLSGITADVSDLRDTLAALDVPAEVSAGMDALRAEFAASDEVDRDTQLTAQMSALARDLSQTRAQIDSIDAGLSERDSRLGDLEAEIAEVRSLAEHRIAQAEAAIDGALAGAGLDLMRAALETGAPYPEAMRLLQDASVAVPDLLAAAAAQGVQTVEMLQEGFPAAARAALRASYEQDSTGGAGARLENFLRSQLGVRSTAPREGDDPDAVLSRAGALIADGNLADTLAELEALPAPALAALASWRSAAQLRQDAQAAFDDFAMTVTTQ